MTVMIRPEGEKEVGTLSHLLWRVLRKMDIGCFFVKIEKYKKGGTNGRI